jgi:hypothetical protein
MIYRLDVAQRLALSIQGRRRRRKLDRLTLHIAVRRSDGTTTMGRRGFGPRASLQSDVGVARREVCIESRISP